MTDYSLAQRMLVDESRVFIDALVDPRNHYAIVIHKTSCGATCTAQEQGAYFQTNADMKSVHYVVGKDGTVVQCVQEKDGAGGNCCLENGHDTFWDKAPTPGNMNLCTFSIEHCDYSNDNSDEMPKEQKDASFALVSYLVKKYGITTDRIKGHNSLDPLSRAKCPGNYDWNGLFIYLGGQNMSAVPNGWSDNGTRLIAPGTYNVQVVMGFRNYVLRSNWDSTNTPVFNEMYTENLSLSDLSLGPGSIQVFKNSALMWIKNKNIVAEYPLGLEFLKYQDMSRNSTAIIGELQKQVEALKGNATQVDFTSAINAVQKVLDDIKGMAK